MDIDGLRLKDVGLFLDLVKTKSIRGLARQRGELPGQISKSIRSLEIKLGNSLIHRSKMGINLTSYAMEILPYLEGIKNYQDKLDGHLENKTEKSVLSFATTSFFSSHFLPQVLAQLETSTSEINYRVIDLSPDQFIPVGLRQGFDICIHLKDLDWPKTWTSVKIGKIKWQLCGRKNHPIIQNTRIDNILKYPFVYPVYWTNEGLRDGTDHFPISIKKRIKGFETSTAVSAAEIVAQTDQLGFLPHLVVKPLVKQKRLQIIDLAGHKPVEESVYLTVKSDTVKQKKFEWLQKECSKLLEY